MDTLLAKLALLLGTLAVGLGVPLSTGVGELPQMPQMVQVHVIGERSLHRFICEGEMVVTIGTAEDYNNDRHPLPAQKNCVLEGSERSTHFDTPDGSIHPGEYALKTVGDKEKVLLFLLSGEQFILDKDDLLMLQTIKL